MAVCPKGHASTADDYCDVCGAPISGPVAAPAPVADALSACPSCEGPLDGRFCESCGHDSLVPPVPAPKSPAPGAAWAAAPEPAASPAPDAAPSTVEVVDAGSWLVVVTADREFFDRVRAMNGPDAESVAFPLFCPERRFPLAARQILIGRRSRSRGVYPEIDLAGPPEDSAVSHMHALLLPQPAGTWAIVDLRSRNCTYVNGDPEPIKAEVPLPLNDGDHVNVGAWTRLTLQALP